LRSLWSNPVTRKKLLDQLSEGGFTREHMDEVKKLINAEKSDIYDVLSYIAYLTPTITREDRANMASRAIIFNMKLNARTDLSSATQNLDE